MESPKKDIWRKECQTVIIKLMQQGMKIMEIVEKLNEYKIPTLKQKPGATWSRNAVDRLIKDYLSETEDGSLWVIYSRSKKKRSRENNYKKNCTNPEKEKCIEIALDLRSKGLTFKEIAEEFNTLNIPLLSGNQDVKWYASIIHILVGDRDPIRLKKENKKAKINKILEKLKKELSSTNVEYYPEDAKKERYRRIAQQLREIGLTYYAIAEEFNTTLGIPILGKNSAAKWYASRIHSLIKEGELSGKQLIDAAHDRENHELLIFHESSTGECNFNKPGGVIAFGIGFPQLPWVCPTCGETVTEIEQLRFSVGKRK